MDEVCYESVLKQVKAGHQVYFILFCFRQCCVFASDSDSCSLAFVFVFLKCCVNITAIKETEQKESLSKFNP